MIDDHGEEEALDGTATRPAHDGAMVTVRDEPRHGRLEGRIDGHLVGHTSRRLWRGQVVLIHTVTEPDWQGRGIATAMTLAAGDLARRHDRRVIPRCPLAASIIARHPELQDLVDEAYRHLVHDRAEPGVPSSEAAAEGPQTEVSAARR